jgi:cold shock CspA family protein
MNGKISRLMSDKGFGFIAADDGQEYLVHRSAIRGGVFETKGDKGLRAENVRVE